ncbi:hypothetical protein O181_036809 [Austropuccinia psidii MF-1]|uniref:DUF4112 domain-containing protein n=1 Tax=Austropuccinia psidii MF-1 TaxID=1389203 RepID=A0A9Q3HBW8_9BASI|nr:hypothetical protein [Austropuccinia psidii MF-1]
MSQILAQKIGRSIVASHAAELEPRDPLYDFTIDPRTSRKKRKKRALPSGLSKREEAILKKIRRRAHYLDKGFSLCGFQFGWTALIGLIPVVGDAADAALSYWLVIRPARKCDLPPSLVQRMFLNQAVSVSIGLIPLVGDILMAVWKVNSRNAALFEDFIVARAQGLAGTSQSPVVAASETAALVDNTTQPYGVDAGPSAATIERQAASGVDDHNCKREKTNRRWFSFKGT